jgi:hypothetical protein
MFSSLCSKTARRASVAGLALALAGGGLLLAPAPAQAGVLDTPSTQVGVSFSGSGSCTPSGPGNVTSPAGTFAADGVPVTSTATSSATYTAADPTDVTTVTTTSTNKITATQAGGALKSIDVVDTAQSTINATKGTAQTCNAQGQGVGVNQASFDLPTAKYVTVEVDSKNSLGYVVFQNAAGPLGGISQTVTFFLHSHLEQRLYLPAGTWILMIQGAGVHSAPTPTNPQPVTSSTVTVGIDFEAPGAARTVSEGEGGKYLDLADGRDCAAGSLTGTWKSKAGKGKHRKVKKATFYVNDVKVKVVKKPRKKSTTTLTGLDPDKIADVRVKLKLAKKGAGTVTVERGYLPCT